MGRRRFGTRVTRTWLSSLPGVNFTATGKLLVRATADLRRKGRRAVCAAARLALDDLAAEITSECLPTQLQEAQERLTLAVAEWAEVEGHPNVMLRARIGLTLTPTAHARMQAYEDALRAERLNRDLDRARLRYLQEVVFAEPVMARTWWLDRQGEELAKLPWQDFNEKVLPSVGTADDAHSRAIRVAHVLAEVIEQLGEDPGRQKQFIATTRVVLKEMGWGEVAEKLPPGQ